MNPEDAIAMPGNCGVRDGRVLLAVQRLAGFASVLTLSTDRAVADRKPYSRVVKFTMLEYPFGVRLVC